MRYEVLVAAVFATRLQLHMDNMTMQPAQTTCNRTYPITDRITHRSGAEKLFAALGKGQSCPEQEQWRVSCDYACNWYHCIRVRRPNANQTYACAHTTPVVAFLPNLTCALLLTFQELEAYLEEDGRIWQPHGIASSSTAPATQTRKRRRQDGVSTNTWLWRIQARSHVASHRLAQTGSDDLCVSSPYICGRRDQWRRVLFTVRRAMSDPGSGACRVRYTHCCAQTMPA